MFNTPSKSDSYKEHMFDASLLNSNSVVVDIGAHQGQFAQMIKRDFNCTVIAFEPEKNKHEILARIPGIIPFNVAVCEMTGAKKFYTYQNDESDSLYERTDKEVKDSYTIGCMTLKDILVNWPDIDLLKIDAEGAEYAIIDSTDDFSGIKQISIEFHGEGWQEHIEGFAAKDIKRAMNKLKKSFNLVEFNNDKHEFLFVREDLCKK